MEDPAAVNPVERTHRFGIGRRALISGAALGMSMSGTMPGVNEVLAEKAPVVAVGVEQGPLLGNDNGTKPAIVEHHVREFHDEVVITPEEQIVQSQNIQMEWARLFSADPNAEKPTNPTEITDIVERIKELEKQGYSISTIELQGWASMEQDSVTVGPDGRNPGFGVPSEKNQQLADERERAVENIIGPLLVDEAGVKIPITRVPGLEMEDPSLAQDIMNYAKDHGTDAVTLVRAYNRHPDTLSEDARKLLDGLKYQRVVNVSVIATKPASSKIVTVEEDKTIFETTGVNQQDDIDMIRFNMIVPIDIFSDPGDTTSVPEPEKAVLPEPVAVEPLKPSHNGPKDAMFKAKSREVSSKFIDNSRNKPRIQPREYNMSRRPSYAIPGSPRGKMPRSVGGNRS